MNCIIIDDEAAARTIVAHLCSQVENLDVIEEFPNAISAMKFLNKNDIDLIFLDLHMPDFNGFDFIETLKNPPKIILTTSDREFAIEAFGYDCIVDYLLKPFAFSRFLKAIQKAQKQRVAQVSVQQLPPVQAPVTPKEKEMYVNIDRRLVKIEFEHIYLIEAKGDYILIKTENKNYTVHSTLKKIVEKLPETIFLKVHRSYIINVKKIIDIEDNSVLIAKNVIPISRSNRPELMRRLNLL